MIIVEESCHELAIEDHLTLFNHMAIDKHYRSSSRRGGHQAVRSGYKIGTTHFSLILDSIDSHTLATYFLPRLASLERGRSGLTILYYHNSYCVLIS